MSKYLRFLGVGFFFFLLILVRAFQSKLFYDPFINYFKNDYLHQVIPKFNSFKLYLNIFFRYLLNSLISIGIIYLLFQKQFLKFSLQFYAIAFVILIFLLFIVLRIQLFTLVLFTKIFNSSNIYTLTNPYFLLPEEECLN